MKTMTRLLFLMTFLLSSHIGAYAQIPSVIFQTTRAVGMPMSIEVRLENDGMLKIDWGNNVLAEYQAGTVSSEIKGILSGELVKIYSDDLTFLNCEDCDIVALDVSYAKKLQQLYCGKNLLEHLDVSGNLHLVRLGCNGNRLTDLSISGNRKLTGLYLQDNLFNSAVLNHIFGSLPQRSSLPDRINLRIKGNPGAKVCETAIADAKKWIVDEKGNGTGGKPVILYTNLPSGSEIFVELRLNRPGKVQIDFGDGIKTADADVKTTRIQGVLRSPEIKIYGDDIVLLKCERLRLYDIDVDNAYNLQQLYCGFNELRMLDVSNNVNLMRLGCNDNFISELDLSANGKLTGMYFQNNKFSAKALNGIFKQLPSRPSKNKIVNFRIINNPGTEKCNVKIAENKNWNIDILDR